MRFFATFLFLVAASCLVLGQDAKVSTAYNPPLLPGTAADSVLNGLTSIRGCTFDTDIDGDGMGEIVVSNYNDHGHVHVFEVVANDSIKLVWTSPTLPNGDGSTPRTAVVGDLDNDGRKEIIFQSNSNGIYIFEWDGVVGSDNYGTTYSALIDTNYLANATGNAEYMEVADVDGDGKNELVVAYNASSNATDGYYIISANGNWNTDDPGFSSFNVEYHGNRNDLGKYGLSGGSPYAMVTANLDGTGPLETLVHAYNYKDVTILHVDSADHYSLCDTTNNKQNIMLTSGDAAALFGGVAFDIDRDGRQEIYLPTYGSTDRGRVDMIHYDQGSNINEIDSTNVFSIDLKPMIGSLNIFGAGYGDIDGDHNFEIYTSTSYPYNVVSLEFQQGGNKTDPASWTQRVLYAGDSTIYSAMTIRDSASASGGFLDTTRTVDGSFVSKLYAHHTDIDGDGFEDIILPYQALSDSISMTKYTWNADSAWYDTLTYKIVNPKRWGLRVIEGSANITGVETKDLTIIMPDQYQLMQNYPNPFNPSTTIRFQLPIKDRISLKIFDMLGREVRTLINQEDYPAGPSQIVWNGKNNAGQQVASGTYFYSLIYGNFHKTMKMSLVK